MLCCLVTKDTLAERSKAVAQGAIPKGRGFEPHRCHFADADGIGTAVCPMGGKRQAVGLRAGCKHMAACQLMFAFEAARTGC